jgi:hypothetical protein
MCPGNLERTYQPFYGDELPEAEEFHGSGQGKS